ncbi:MAG: nicotinate phosphoribosyltransferase, partial [Planctomycetota bacterium]
DRFDVGAIRLDSGDLAELAKAARRRLDAAGLTSVRIFASSGLDEHRIAALLDAGAPIDGFGVGTRMAVMEDAPAVDMAYKLVAYAGQPRLKLSADKAIHPGTKQVYRTVADGRVRGDVICGLEEPATGQPLLQPVMRGGRRLPAACLGLEAIRSYAMAQLEQLPDDLRRIDHDAGGVPYPVRFSDALTQARRDMEREHEPAG